MFERCQWDEEPVFHVWHPAHAVMLVEQRGLIIEGVDDQEVRADVGAQDSRHRVSQEGRAQPVPLKSRVYGETPDEDGRERPIARQLLAPVVFEIIEGNLRRRERVITRDRRCRRVDRDESRGDLSADILGHLRLEVTVETVLAAGEA